MVEKLNCSVLIIYLYTMLSTLAMTAATKTHNYSFVALNDVRLSTDLKTVPKVDDHQVQHLCFNSTNGTCLCSQVCDCHIICSEGKPILEIGYYATYSEDTRLLSIFPHPTFYLNSYNVVSSRYIRLPSNLSHLNNYMCGPLNRKGVVCSECVDSFGPSVTSSEHWKCVNCTNTWYGVPVFLLIEFVPITVFYLFILALQVRVTSAPMPCFIMYSQTIICLFDLAMNSNSLSREVMFTNDGSMKLHMQIIHTFYGVFNLDFFRMVIPSFCISSKLQPVHLTLFGYIAIFYPLFLIFLTCVCVELHGRNFKPLVWVWKPFHRCFVQLRRGWNTQSDIIDVFTTFSFLMCSKCMYMSVLILITIDIMNFDESGNFIKLNHRLFVDTLILDGSSMHILLLFLAVPFFVLFHILPLVLLIFYPYKVFRSCLAKCRLNFTVLNIFAEKIHGCYRDGLDGGRDMRSFSGIYYFVRFLLVLTAYLCQKLSKDNEWLSEDMWFPIGTVFLTIAIVIALSRPYKKSYMNILDTLLLSNLALKSYVISSKFNTSLTITILMSIPIAVFFLTILLRLIVPKMLQMWRPVCLASGTNERQSLLIHPN